MISKVLKVIAMISLIASASNLFGKHASGDQIQVQDVKLIIPNGWTLHQNARDQGNIILGFKNNENYLRLYVAPRTEVAREELFLNHGAQLLYRDSSDKFSLGWERIHTSHVLQNRESFTSGFLLELNGYTYYGYSTSQSLSQADANVSSFLSQMN